MADGFHRMWFFGRVGHPKSGRVGFRTASSNSRKRKSHKPLQFMALG
jgi:hypothetical protein